MARSNWSRYKAEWQALVDAGVTLSEVGRRYGAPSSTVGNILNPERVRAYNEKRKEYRRAWDAANQDRKRASGRKARRKLQGIKNPTGETRSGPCQICNGHQDTLHLDHDAKTGEARGWLCGPCNRAIGMMKDSPVLLRRAADYLEEHVRRN